MNTPQAKTELLLGQQDTRGALRDHAARRARAARAAYGPMIDYPAILRMLEDRAVVRYPTTICFDASALEPGEFAYAAPSADDSEMRYRLYVHPVFAQREEVLPMLIAYHLVRINYGDVATSEEAEVFGATLLGIEVDEYYGHLCVLADSIPAAANQ